MKPLAIRLAAITILLIAPGARAQDELTFSPEDYGAVADDGGDDRAAIQSALNAAAAAAAGS